MANSDEPFVRYVLQTGMATDAQIAAARKRLTENAEIGTISDVMVREGIITTAQRETVERKLKAQSTGIQQLDNFKLIKKLGEGGMGSVYLAEDTVGYRKVALKVLSRKYSTNPEFLGRFRREAQALGRLNHPNIVAGFNVGEDRGYQYYVMEYCDGEPLDKRLRREKQLQIYDAIEITTQVARGLQYAHEHNTIHRDIKPGNLVATTDGLIKILDMGLSKNLGEADSSFNTQAGVTVGTPHYISPEQARGDASVDGRTDIYSLGATLYHLITGRTPFEGPTSVVIMTKHLNEQLENPADLRPDCPEGLIEVITRMMAKRADDRYLNCAELIEDLEQVAAGKNPSSPALDPIHSSIGMRSLRVGTGVYKPVGGEREGKETAVGKRGTGKREPISGTENARASVRKSGQRPAASMPEQDPGAAQENSEPSSRNRRVTSKESPTVPGRLATDQDPIAALPPAARPGLNMKLVGAAAAAIVLGSAGIYVGFSSKKPDTVAAGPAHTASPTAISTSVSVDPKQPTVPSAEAKPVAPPAVPAAVTPAPVVPAVPATPVVPHPAVAPAITAALSSGAEQVEVLIRQRNYPRAKQRLDELEREVGDKDTYNVRWCSRLDGLDRSIQNGESALRQEFRKQLAFATELPPMPAGSLLLFNYSNGSDPRIKWSPRTIKFYPGKLPWVDGLGDSKTMTFDAPENLLTTGPNGKVVFEYSATVQIDAVLKFQNSDEKWKELPVTLTPGRMRKVEIVPGGKFMSGLQVRSIAVEFTNSRDDALAMYRIYVLKQ